MEIYANDAIQLDSLCPWYEKPTDTGDTASRSLVVGMLGLLWGTVEPKPVNVRVGTLYPWYK